MEDVTIFDLSVRAILLPHVTFRVPCSKGTYVRTLARDLGKQIGCGAHLARLRRVRSGPCALDRSLSWEKLQTLSASDDLGPWVITLKEALKKLPKVVGDERSVRKIRVGQEMAVRDLSSEDLPAFKRGSLVQMTSSEGGLVAILKSLIGDADVRVVNPDTVAFRPLRVFRNKREFKTKVTHKGGNSWHWLWRRKKRLLNNSRLTKRREAYRRVRLPFSASGSGI